MKKLLTALLAVFSALIFSATTVQAGQLDVLIDKLVEKGILSSAEAQIVLDETKKEIAKEIAHGKSDASPSWAQKIKLKGDLRLRYQKTHSETSEAVHKGRLRYRLGVEAKINEQLKVAAGIASGSSDPRSTNVDFEDSFSSKGIALDLAYMEYSPYDWMTVVGGKFPRKAYLWQTGDMLWDGDINPEGGSIALTHAINDIELFLNAGIWNIDESSSDTSDPFLAYVQPGFKVDLMDGVSLKTALTVYQFNSLQKTTLDSTSGTNTVGGDGSLDFDYDSLNPNVELGFSEPFDGVVPFAAVFGSYIYNYDEDASDIGNNTGFQAGLKFGDKAIKDKGQWQAKYQYTRLEKDAFPDAFPDSDRYGGRTDARGHEAIIDYGLAKNVTLSLDYYRTERILAARNPEHVLQADVVFKF